MHNRSTSIGIQSQHVPCNPVRIFSEHRRLVARNQPGAIDQLGVAGQSIRLAIDSRTGIAKPRAARCSSPGPDLARWRPAGRPESGRPAAWRSGRACPDRPSSHDGPVDLPPGRRCGRPPTRIARRRAGPGRPNQPGQAETVLVVPSLKRDPFVLASESDPRHRGMAAAVPDRGDVVTGRGCGMNSGTVTAAAASNWASSICRPGPPCPGGRTRPASTARVRAPRTKSGYEDMTADRPIGARDDSEPAHTSERGGRLTPSVMKSSRDPDAPEALPPVDLDDPRVDLLKPVEAQPPRREDIRTHVLDRDDHSRREGSLAAPGRRAISR